MTGRCPNIARSEKKFVSATFTAHEVRELQYYVRTRAREDIVRTLSCLRFPQMIFGGGEAFEPGSSKKCHFLGVTHGY